MIEILLNFSQLTGISAFMNSTWGWPLAESIHFFGLCLLIGTVGLFDLRIIGIANDIAISELHRLVPIGVAGYLLNVLTGIMFLSTSPDQYLYNPAVLSKLFFMLIAGINMLFFYATTAADIKSAANSSRTLLRAKIMAGLSLFCWCAVIVCGRLITYYRPPYHWCLWC